jgi:hypothetical protein
MTILTLMKLPSDFKGKLEDERSDNNDGIKDLKRLAQVVSRPTPNTVCMTSWPQPSYMEFIRRACLIDPKGTPFESLPDRKDTCQQLDHKVDNDTRRCCLKPLDKSG